MNAKIKHGKGKEMIGYQKGYEITKRKKGGNGSRDEWNGTSKKISGLVE